MSADAALDALSMEVLRVAKENDFSVLNIEVIRCDVDDGAMVILATITADGETRKVVRTLGGE